MNISRPFNVTASTSPIAKIDQKARARVPWATAGLAQKAAAVLHAFVEVFRENHWHYAAGGFPGMKTNLLLTGEQTMQQLEAQFRAAPSMDCGRIRNLLAMTLQALLPVTPADARVTGLFVTRRLGVPPPGVQGAFSCIDTNVYGNVRTTTQPYQLVNQCLFEDHYAVKLNETGMIYDGCLVSVYPDINVVVDTLLKKSPADPSVLIPRTPPPPGRGQVTRYQTMRDESPNGFTVGYMKL